MGSVVLLPNGKQQFLDNNGMPLSGGKVYFYIAPGTTTPKNTWKDSARVTLNTNPVLLDAAGEAVIFGVGDYRQIVNDALGNVIWDAQTSGLGGDTYGEVSTGSANAQVLATTDFAARNGQLITFTAGFSNSGPMTINAGFGAVPVYKNTISGETVLAAGDIVANDVFVLMYDSINVRFVIVNLVTYLPLGGGTLTGDLTISKASPSVILNRPSTSTANNIRSLMNGLLRWWLVFGSNETESGSNAGSNLYLDRYDDAGNYIGGAIGINRATGTVSLPAGQLQFPATQNPSANANTLDDYEEGTWTPAFSATGATFSYSLQQGKYTKIGRLLYLYVKIILNTTGNTLTANPVIITGLPFSTTDDLAVATCNFIGATSACVGVFLGTVTNTLYIQGMLAANTSNNAQLNANVILAPAAGSVIRSGITAQV